MANPYEKPFQISEEVLEYARKLVRKERSLLVIAEEVEKKIAELGGKPAFPVNLSVNEVAAHFTPDVDRDYELKEGDLVKVDVGIHVDGYICDRAFTVCVGKSTHPMIKACENALKKALKKVKPGVKVCEISEVVEEEVRKNGYVPIINLCGHGLERYKTHAEPTIPNVKNNITYELKEGEAIAIEVFVTDGSGWVKESRPSLIFRFLEEKFTRSPEARKILSLAKEEFNGLPFAKRWLRKHIQSNLKLELALKELVEVGALKEYPILKEESSGLVAQAEETVIV